jgi:hypothetical protein
VTPYSSQYRGISSAWASVSIMEVRKQSTADTRSIVSRAVSSECENGTTSSAWTYSLKGRVPSRVLGAWMPQVVMPAQAAARLSGARSSSKGT